MLPHNLLVMARVRYDTAPTGSQRLYPDLFLKNYSAAAEAHGDKDDEGRSNKRSSQ
jgi:hypothetical protein